MVELEMFIRDNLDIDARIDDYFTLGAKQPKTIVIFFQSVCDKVLVMKNKKLLKNVRSDRNNKIFINDYIPSIQQERRFRENQIQVNNSKAETPQNIQFVKGKLTIQGQTYKKKVTSPLPKDLVDIEPDDLDVILKVKMEK